MGTGFLSALIDALERNVISALMGGMVVITFINVVLRYGFNSGLIWGLEVTLVLFAWLVLLGTAYGVRTTHHLGVDTLLVRLPARVRYRVNTLAALACIVYAALLTKGAWDYWAPFAGLPATEGRWLPLGFDWTTRDQGWFETDQIPMFDWLRFIEPMFNAGEAYEKMPRFIPYFVLPLGAGLMLYRFVRAWVDIVRGHSTSLIVSYEYK